MIKKVPWNKGMVIDRSKYPSMGHFTKHTKISRKKMSNKLKGKITWQKGLTKDTDPRIYAGKRHHNWKGGITNEMDYERRKLKHNGEWEKWRVSVFKRDEFTCQLCGSIGTYLNPHHIKSFKDFQEERLSISNGITLCRDCHLLVHYDSNFKNNFWYIRKEG